jgi:hypothetical protein
LGSTPARFALRALAGITLSFTIVVAQSTVALADNLISDGDGVVPVVDSNLAFGNVCAGTTVTRAVLLAVSHNGGGTSTFGNSASVTVSKTGQGPHTGVAGTITVSPAVAGVISLPSNWTSTPNNTLSSAVSTTIQLVAGATPGVLSEPIEFSAQGINTSDNPLTRTDSMTVSATVIGCDSAAPVVTVTAPSAPGGQGGYFNAANVPVTVNVSASDPSGVTSIACADGVSPISFAQSGSNPRTGSFQLSADGAHNVSCTAVDGLGNSGAGAGSSNTATVLIDTVAPSVSCGSADGAWHGADVSIACAAADLAGSGLRTPGDASFSLTTSVAPGVETANASTGSHDVNDVAGNHTTAGPVGGNKVDKKAPQEAGCDSPAAGWQSTNVTLQCAYTDGGSGPGTLHVDLTTSIADGDETADATASAGGAQACDSVGNCASSPDGISGNKVDRKAPALVSCDAADSIWHAANVALDCTYADGGSGPATQTVSVQTHVADGAEDGDAAATTSDYACDGVGNCAAAPADISGNMIDRKAPQLDSCGSPDGTWHGSNLSLTCSYLDGGSGLVTPTVELFTDVDAGTEDANASASANGAQACDTVGNCAASPEDIAGNKIDRKNPVVACGSPDGQWHQGDVSIHCTAEDLGSGLANASDASFDLWTSIAAGTETNDAATDSRDVADAVGNHTVAGPVSGNMVDVKAPVVVCDAPPSGWSGDDVTIHCTAGDGGSGLADSGDEAFDLTTSVPSGTETANASTDSRSVCDAVGNCTTAGPFTGIQIDKKAPGFACADPDGNWHGTNVSLECTASDLGSGLNGTSPSSFDLTTDVGSGVETADASTDSRELCDAVGNCATAGPIDGNRVDRRAPQLSGCDAPDGAWHQNDVTLDCSYTDGGSGAGTLKVPLQTNVAPGSEDANAAASASGAQACDAVGNCASPPSDIGGNKVDRKAPTQVACDSADGLWHAANVTLHCSYSDGGSGPGSQQVALSTVVPSGAEDANASASAGTTQACDAVGNCASSPADIAGNRIDRSAPQLVGCDAADGLWHGSNVTLYCTYSDGGSGPASQQVSLATNVPAGLEDANASATTSGHACDEVSNCAASPSPIAGNRIDRKAPTVTFTTPSGAGTSVFALNQSVGSSFTCQDGGSGVAALAGCVAPSSVDTSTVGSKTFAASTRDNVGNVGSSSASYAVLYATGPCLGSAGHQVLQPINADGSSSFKKGSTVPVKFRVCDALGNPIGAADVVSAFRFVKKVNGTVESTVNEDPISTTPDTAFRWDPTGKLWIYNLNTKSLSSGYTYYYSIDLNDGSSINFLFYVRG